jgi:signal transduction histidine kinase
MTLSAFIHDNHLVIEAEWVAFARSIQPKGGPMSRTALLDHGEQILSAIVSDMEQPETNLEQAEKSKGRGEEQRLGAVGQGHAVQRLERGFKLDQLVAEYRALRASVLRLWEKEGGGDLHGITRFNESIDEALVEATNQYSQSVDRYREQFLAMLGHDLRNPLSAIIMGASLMTKSETLDDRQSRVANHIRNSADRMTRLVDDLLDLTRTNLGSGIPIVRSPIDLLPVCQQVVAEVEGGSPGHPVQFRASGDLHGEWDSDRLAQVLSNLLGNAVQHGEPDSPVRLLARADGDDVVLEVHNQGKPIPPEAMATIFEPMVRYPSAESHQSSSLGLGLYIAHEVVIAHGGELKVTSTARDGTVFEARLPRVAKAKLPGAPVPPPAAVQATPQI